MKNYALYTETERKEAIQSKRDQLVLFQDFLRNHPQANDRFHGKALEIAHGLQPWIDALKISLRG